MAQSFMTRRRHDGKSLIVLMIVLVLLPLLCISAWIVITGPADFGRKYGILSDFKLQTVTDPSSLAALAAADTLLPKSGQPSENIANFDLLLTREAAARLMSVAATAMLVLVAGLAGAYGWVTFWNVSEGFGEQKIPLLLLAMFIAAVLIWATWPEQGGRRIYDLLGNGVFESTVGKIHDRVSLNLLDFQQRMNNIVLVIAGVGLTFSAAVIGGQAFCFDPPADLELYGPFKRKLDMVLLASSLMLATGIIDLKQWTTLPLPFMVNKDLASAYAVFASGYVALQSLFYVAALVAMFVPAAWLLDNARQRITQGVPAKAAPSRAPLRSFVAGDLLRIAGMLAPILVGPIANFVSIRVNG